MSVRVKFYLVIALAVVVALLALPREDKILQAVGFKKAHLQIKRGLDLQGGAYLTYQADLSKTAAKDRPTAVSGVVNVIEKRVNPTGTSEVVVQTSGSDRIVVQLPGVTDINQAINLIGQTAQLNFFELPSTGPQLGSSATAVIPTDLTGKDLKSATASLDPQTGKPVIRFQMKDNATKKFSDLTTRINQKNERLLIVLDNQTLFNGGVTSPITDGNGQMEGFTSLDDAKKTAVLLNAGALPVPVNLVAQSTVGATLGSEAVQKSVVAGIIGLLAVIVFMCFYYRLAGLLASAALIIYTLINITYFKLSGLLSSGVFIIGPIVLSLAGIAGFILSVGMAVDANILIFERTKEEAREGKAMPQALNDGFRRAWNSIRDSNISTLITCIILFWFGGNPLIKGFAVTLAIGVLISMFTAITITKTFLQMILRTRLGHNARLYGVKNPEVRR